MERRRKNAASKMCSYMNNTKWVKVFNLICDYELSFSLSWVVGNNQWDSESLWQINKSLISKSGLLDPGVGGPCNYRNIKWIRLPFEITHFEERNRQIYRSNSVKQLLDEFEKKVNSLGVYPLIKTNDYIEITGYK